MNDEKWTPKPIGAGETGIDGDPETPPTLFSIAVGATIVGVVGAVMPPLPMLETVGFLMYLIGALCGLVCGIAVATYRASRVIGITCALVSLGLLGLFPLVFFKPGLMGDG